MIHCSREIHRERSVADPDPGPEIQNPGSSDILTYGSESGMEKIRRRDPRTGINNRIIFREPNKNFLV